MFETLIVIMVINLGFTGYTFFKHKQLETIVLYGTFPGGFPDDPRVPEPDTVPAPEPKMMQPRPAGEVKRKPISRTDAQLFDLEKNNQKL